MASKHIELPQRPSEICNKKKFVFMRQFQKKIGVIGARMDTMRTLTGFSFSFFLPFSQKQFELRSIKFEL